MVFFPYKQDEERPKFASWQEGGIKLSWKGETHYILLDTQEHQINSEIVEAKTSAIVVKLRDDKLASVTLPAGGRAASSSGLAIPFKIEAPSEQPAGQIVADSDRREQNAKVLAKLPLPKPE